jgi:predicted permease
METLERSRMRLLRRLTYWLRFRSSQSELRDEMDFHRACLENDFRRRGFDPVDAADAARRTMGNETFMREESRGVWIMPAAETIWKDWSYAWRGLRRSPTFTLVAVLSLALAIGANTAMFTVVDALMLRSLPVPHPEQLVTIGDPSATGSFSQGSPRYDTFSYPIYADVRDHATAFSGVYATGQAGALDVLLSNNMSATPEHPVGRFVTGSYFDVLQVPAEYGRVFTGAEDAAPNADPFVVISHGYWLRRFGGDRAAIGRKLSINGTIVTVVGVMPASFSGDVIGGRADLWIPMMMQPALKANRSRLNDRTTSWLLLMGRLAPGKTLAQARTAVRGVIEQSLRTNMSDSNWVQLQRELRTAPIDVESGARGFSYFRTAYAQALGILMATVAVVLLVVCANVANLMLARAAARGREISVRLALGADRSRLIQQLLTESMLLGLVSAVVGLAFAVWGTRILLSIASGGPAPIPLDVHVDMRILLYTLAITLSTVVLFGLVPALRATRLQVADALRTRGGGVAMGARRRFRLPLAKALVAGQVALSMLLLIGTGVLLRSMERIGDADLGLDRDHLLVATIDAQHRGYTGARLTTLIHDVVDRARRVPGVAAVSYSENGIFTGTEAFSSMRAPGFTIRADSDRAVSYDLVGPEYFRAIGAPIARGREFTEEDNERSAKVVILNETMARYYFANGDALGRTITRRDSTLTIVGIARDVEEQDVRAKPIRRMYLPSLQATETPGVLNLIVRGTGDPAALSKPLLTALSEIDAALPVTAMPVNALVQGSMGQSLLMTQVISFFGALALLLAALGLYGVMAFTTARRTSEFGLRVALGAGASSVTGMVLREALGLAAVGFVVGLPAGVLATQLIRSQLFGVDAFDPITALGATIVLAFVALVAAGVPALRAARVSPLEALRAE